MKVNYPTSKKTDAVDRYFDVEINDPYRWLEDDESKETQRWIDAQNKVTAHYLDKIPFCRAIEIKLKSFWDYERNSAPTKEGPYFYFRQNDGLQDQDIIYRTMNLKSEVPQVFLDPNNFSNDGTTSLDQLTFSTDGAIAAYTISEGGSDWRKVVILDAKTKNILESPLENVKFSSISWLSNIGFYYSSYEKPGGSELSSITAQHKLYFHALGEPQNKDTLVFGGDNHEQYRYVHGEVSKDNQYLIISAANTTSGNSLFVKDLSNSNTTLVTILDGLDSDISFLDNKGTQLLFSTNKSAAKNRVVSVDINSPHQANWSNIIPEADNVLLATAACGYLFAEYVVDISSQVIQFDYSGQKVRDVKLPGAGNVEIFGDDKTANKLYYTFTNYITPPIIYEYEPANGKSSIFKTTDMDFDTEDYVTTQVFYPSLDGTKIPMLISHKKDLDLNGEQPTILYGYGVFNVSLLPIFNTAMAYWMKLGGIYAVANIRGGGEYGRQWHEAGTLQQKQTVFDDFIKAAEYLIERKYTSRNKLAIRGGSNGGLLVAATMNQRPDLIKVALPAVGVMDMLRYHKFTAGAGWAHDYGTAEQSKEMFVYLKAYSPLHNIQASQQYPATLISTADRDDRVVPSHSFKYAATLQSNQSGDAPILIRIEHSAGHGAGTAVNKQIKQYADLISFTLYNMEVAIPPP